MSDAKLGLGEIIQSEQFRDAIHVAVAPVVAACGLAQAEHIGLNTSGEATNDIAETKLIGIVDPFLSRRVRRGEKFWMFLYPNTVTGMRHEWQHPAFGNSPSQPKAISEAEITVRNFCNEYSGEYDTLLGAWINDREYCFGSDLPYGDMERLERALTALTGKEHTEFGFRCAC